jgi:outer membrane protein assembly factor BamB
MRARANRAAARAPARAARSHPARIVVALAALAALAGCSSLSSWIPSIPPPSFGWLFGGKKIGPLPEFKATVAPRTLWQINVGRSAAGLSPAVTPTAVYAASSDGTIVRANPDTGSTAWRIDAGMKLSAGVGADATLLAVGTDKGVVAAFDVNGKELWKATVTSEVISPPIVAEDQVSVWSGDGHLYSLDEGDGKTRWVYQRENPPLIVRNTAGGVIYRGGLFTGTAGGKLVAIDVKTGNVAWEGNVATPKGATELERIADITSLPVISDRQVCAAAFQGRIACFELVRGTLAWTRDLSSLAGIAVDSRYLYVTDDSGAIHALDKTTGSSVWKQDKLAKRQPTGPQLLGDYLAVVDVEGYLHVLDRSDGSLVGRLATDGSPATAQPAASGANVVWQSVKGTLYAVSAP